MIIAFPFSWQPKIKKQGFIFTENSIVKIKGLYILPFDKKHLRKMVPWTINCHYTLLPPMLGYLLNFIYISIQNATDACL